MDDRAKGVLPTSDKHSRVVLDHSVEDEMETSYLQYSMSVIVARALAQRSGRPASVLLVLAGIVYGFLPGPNLSLDPAVEKENRPVR